MKKITIYDLAELSGVSASAVSAILNGNWKKRRISAKLAEKVTRIAQEQGYAINRQASMLRSKKSHVIGMIVPKYDNRYFGSVAEGFEEMARERGLLPIITCTRRRPELEIEAAPPTARQPAPARDPPARPAVERRRLWPVRALRPPPDGSSVTGR